MAKVLKGFGPPPGGRVIEREVYDAAARASEILACAEAEAARIVADARERAELVRAEAARAGREEGLGRASEALARAAATRQRAVAGAERELSRLAIDVAEKVLGRELREPGAVADLAAAALARARGQGIVTLRVNPADAPQVALEVERLTQAAGGAAVVVEAAPSVTAGSAVVATEHGTVDARVETQLAAILRAFEDADSA
jgi:type III secretion system HrpE/YscL family protein